MPVRLSEEEVVTIGVLADKGKNHCEIARTLGVSEGTVRYHLRRQAEGAQDGRRQKGSQGEALAGIIGAWMQGHPDGQRPPNVRQLYDHLVYECDYSIELLSFDAALCAPALAEAEAPHVPASGDAAWGPEPGGLGRVSVGNELEPLSAFIMVLSHSRRPAIVWSRRRDQLVLAAVPQRELSPTAGSGRRQPDRQRQDGHRLGRRPLGRDPSAVPGLMLDRWVFTLMPVDRGKPKRRINLHTAPRCFVSTHRADSGDDPSGAYRAGSSETQVWKRIGSHLCR